ncbi:lipoprotein-anchoring transpeptidase ErfK/SrfK [Nakamurella sp. UYEF19]|uniref:L,D-transpeptidase n=1 Tax=Nakamurella sp. UYEF19 TaxID=1756392 RepID=UPI00339945E3
MPDPSRGRSLAALLVLPVILTLVLSACTSTSSVRSGQARPGSTTSSPVVTVPPAGSAEPETPVQPGTSGQAGTTAPTAITEPPVSPIPTTSSSTAPAVITPVLSSWPVNGADDVSPIRAVLVRVQKGTLTKVTMTNPDGRAVRGAISKDKTAWTSTEPLGYGRKYSVTSIAVSATGVQARSSTTFTTVSPTETIYPSFFPNPEMKTVGVGQPMVVIFDKAPADKVAAEKALVVKTVPAVEGSWYWWDDRTLHYRPKVYWKAGTKITVNVNLYGVALGGGAYGETDRTLSITVGRSKIATVDDATKQMQVFIDGKKVRTIPVSMGMDKKVTVGGKEISFVTPSGIYVGQEKYAVKQMSSATYGLPVASSLGYDSRIPLAVRFSNEGIFVHAAPWSVADQGVRNVSHGCLNINPEAGRWFYDNFSYGDILTVTGTATKLAVTDGYGDWNMSWADWKKGSALA